MYNKDNGIYNNKFYDNNNIDILETNCTSVL